MLEIEVDDSPVITKLIFSAQETHIIAGTNDAKIVLWDQHPESKPSVLLGHKTAITDLLCSPDQSRFVTVGSGNYMLIWNFAEQALAHEVLHSSAITSVAGLNSRLFLTSGADNTLVTREFEAGKLVDEPEIAYGEEEGTEMNATRYAASMNGSTLAKSHAAPRNFISLWDTQTGEFLLKTTLKEGYEVSMMCFSQDGHWLAVASKDQVMVFDVRQEDKVVMELQWSATT